MSLFFLYRSADKISKNCKKRSGRIFTKNNFRNAPKSDVISKVGPRLNQNRRVVSDNQKTAQFLCILEAMQIPLKWY